MAGKPQPLPKQLLRLVGDAHDPVDGRPAWAAGAGRAGADRDQRPAGRRHRRAIARVAAPAILGEPCKRDTAPCIGLAALQLVRTDPDAIMAVMPSDHVISPDAAFQQAIAAAARLVAETPGRIVTFGIKPSYPAESFGYIERGEPLATPRAGRGPALRALSRPAVPREAQGRRRPAVSGGRQLLLELGHFRLAGPDDSRRAGEVSARDVRPLSTDRRGRRHGPITRRCSSASSRRFAACRSTMP